MFFRVLQTLGLAFGVLGGVAASQAPEFAQQYAQRLGGTVDELRRAVTQFDADAAGAGETREGAIARLRANDDRLAQHRGDAARADGQRLGELQVQQQRLGQATGPLDRVRIMLTAPDSTVAWAAYRDYLPAVPVTGEGFLCAAIGFVGGWGVWRLLIGGGRRLGRLASGRRPARLREA